MAAHRRGRAPDATFRWSGLVSLVVVGGAVLFVFWQLHPDLIFRNTLPTGGDNGGHVWGPAFLRDHILNHGRLSGWAPDWYSGFPAYQFYMVVPALFVVALDVILPYAVAFKLVTVLGVCTLPVAAWAFGKLAGARFPSPELLALGTLPFLFDTGFSIYGGNVASTLAGEFAFAISLSFALLALGLVANGMRTGRHRAAAAVALALTVLCHLIPAIFAIVGCAVIFLSHRPNRARVWWMVTAGLTAIALSGFWLFPFVARHAYFNDMGWVKLDALGDNLFPGRLLWAFILAAVALVGAAIRRDRLAPTIAAIGVVIGLGFAYAPQAALWNARLLPFWYLCLYLVAALGFLELALGIRWFILELVAAGAPTSARRSRRTEQWTRYAVPFVAGLVVITGVGGPLGALPDWWPKPNTTVSYLPGWARSHYAGYPAAPAYGEFQAFVSTMAKVGRQNGCGQSLWEFSSDLDRYGSTMAPMLLPYFTDGCIGSMEGVYFESSQTTPFHFLMQSTLSAAPSRPQRDLPYTGLDVRLGVQQLQLMGIRYYMASSASAIQQAAADTDLREVATTGPWHVYEVKGTAPVVGLPYLPAVLGKGAWRDNAISWFAGPTWPVELARSGPPSWPRVSSGTNLTQVPVAPAKVTNVRRNDDRISFDVDKIGTPVLVRTSYYPNWVAEGAKGPYRVAPNQMVVVPTSKHVRLRYGRTPVDLAGSTLTLLGLGGFTALILLPPLPVAAAVRRRRSSRGAGPTAETAAGPPT
ncbi:MAG: hypothetical protein JWL73_1430 [Actinomycetia bacterium]|nr:hypothetical protein [Actinomycetes bacterium]